MTGGGSSVDCHQSVETTETTTNSSTHSRSSNSSSLSSLERATEFVTNWCSGGELLIQCTSTTDSTWTQPVTTSHQNMTALSPAPSRCSRSRSVERLPKDSMMMMKTEQTPDATVQEQHEYHHQRSVSDFVYTTQTSTVATTTTSEDESSWSSSDNNKNMAPFPTFPRFPVEANHDKNCWSEPPISLFTVRGPRYFQDSKKVASGPCLLQARGTDLFLIPPDKNSKQHPHNKDLHLENLAHRILGGNLRKKPTLAIYFCFPWGYMNLYFEIPAHLAIFLQPPASQSSNSSTMASIDADPQLTTAEKTFAKWLVGDADYKNERLKLIPYVAAGPWAVRNMVTGRPAIIGKKLPVTYHLHTQNNSTAASTTPFAPLLTVTLDVGSSSNAAKRIVSVCRRYMSALTVDLGFLIQANTDQELPEQMLATIRVHGPEPLQATTIHQS